MSRKRSTWNTNRKADPYQMNQERDTTPVKDYLIGDSSAFGEGVHQDLPKDEELGRNEVGLPNPEPSNMDHKDVDKWNSQDSYDNSDTVTPKDADGKGDLAVPVEDMNDRKVATQKQSAREVFAALERKAYHCTKIAHALLPGAPMAMIEDQSYELMALPDNFVLAAVTRLAKEDEKEDEVKEDEKEASKDETPEKEEEVKEESDKKSSSDLSDREIEAMLREMREEAEEEAEEDEKEASKDEAPEKEEVKEEVKEEAPEKEEAKEEAPEKEASMDSVDPEINAMIEDMLGEDAMPEEEISFEMTPMMDVTSTEDMMVDPELLHIFDNTIPKEARATHEASVTAKTASQGVQSLGRVKEASTTKGDYDLSKLWHCDPDISGLF